MLKVEFELADLDHDDVDIQEDRGHVRLRIGNHLTPEEMVAAVNTGFAAFLAGGHWFQEWKGDIITAAPEPSDRHLRAAPFREDVTRPDAAA